MSYVVKVKNIQTRPDANFIKYWVDSYEYVAYRGLNKVLHLTDGNTDLFITDSDRGNWDIVELSNTDTPAKPLDFVRDRYIWAGIGNDLVLNHNLVIYREFDDNVRINNEADYSISGAALWVVGGAYFGKAIFINKSLNVANNLLVSDVSSAITINSTINATLNAEQTSTNSRGALYIKGGLAVEQDIIANNVFLKGMIDAKGGVRLGSIASVLYISNTTDAAVTPTGVASVITDGGMLVKKDLIVSGNIRGHLIGNVAGNITGDVAGNLTGSVSGPVSGNVTGSLRGKIRTVDAAATSRGVSFGVSAYHAASGSGSNFVPARGGHGEGSISIGDLGNGYPFLYKIYNYGRTPARGDYNISHYGAWAIGNADAYVSISVDSSYDDVWTAGCTIYIYYLPLFTS